MQSNHHRFALLVIVSGLTLLLGACNSFESRAKEKSSTFDQLSPRTQERLERGTIHVGDTQDMVYIALGHPDEKRDRSDSDGTQTIWIYKSYWQQYEGTQWVGWRRVIVPRSGLQGGYVVYHEPVTAELYSSHEDEVIRVTFRGDHVVSVDQQRS
ncbi:MAG TPA: hypothetical protein VKC51_11585 [Lacunisphaera sp.]|nr:hypothetical protein [Lacunisphaera sp.]